MRHPAALAVLLVAWSAAPSSAQAPGPPGPYVIDVRGATTSLPPGLVFVPPLSSATFVPSRSFGLDVGGHIYPLHLGPARLGVGLDYIRARGTSAIAATATTTSTTTTAVPSIHVTVTSIAPQISFNFGSRTGWSYLSAGVGQSRVQPTLVQDGAPDDTRPAERVQTINFGGGARWFSKRRFGVSFDIRFLMLEASAQAPKARIVSASVGVALR